MQCPFCAEEIKDAAVVCRFCGAVKEAAEWKRPTIVPGVAPSGTPAAPKGTFTIKSTAVLFGIGALFELVSMTSAVPLFGALRGGVTAILYHVVYAAAFAAVGFGLWRGTRLGYRAVFATTALYTFDRILYLFDTAAREAELATSFGGNGHIFEELIDKNSIMQLATLTTWLVLAGWWGLAWYIYRRRAYFEQTR